MPPASLSTFAVMKPGPTTANTSSSRALQLFAMSLMAPPLRVPQHRDHVVGGDDARETAMLVDDRERDQVVLVEQGSHVVLRRIRRAGDEGLAQFRELD